MRARPQAKLQGAAQDCTTLLRRFGDEQAQSLGTRAEVRRLQGLRQQSLVAELTQYRHVASPPAPPTCRPRRACPLSPPRTRWSLLSLNVHARRALVHARRALVSVCPHRPLPWACLHPPTSNPSTTPLQAEAANAPSRVVSLGREIDAAQAELETCLRQRAADLKQASARRGNMWRDPGGGFQIQGCRVF